MIPTSEEPIPVKPITHKNQWLQYTAGFLATIPMFIAGNTIGWSSPSLIKIQNHITASESTWLASISNLGTMFFSFFVGILTAYFGRKITLLISGPLFLLSWILLYIAEDIAMLYAGRFISGFGVAICSMVCSLYIGEVSEKNIRGRLLSLMTFMSTFGTVVGLSVGPYVTYYHFELILSVFPIIFFFTFMLMPKSPYFNLQKGEKEKAMKCLLRLRALDDPQILTDEFNAMQKSIEIEMANKSSYLELFKDRYNRKSLIVVLGVKTMMIFSASGAIQTYIGPIFSTTNSFISPSMVGILCGVIQLVACMVSYIFVDHFGRKPLLIGSLIGCFITLVGAGTYFFIVEVVGKSGDHLSWLPISSIMIFMAVQPIGVGNLAYVLQGELFPANIKDQAGVISTVYGAVLSFLIVKLFGVIGTMQKMYITFFGCAIFMLLGLVFTVVAVPETKQKTLCQIQKEINGDYSKSLKGDDKV